MTRLSTIILTGLFSCCSLLSFQRTLSAATQRWYLLRYYYYGFLPSSLHNFKISFSFLSDLLLVPKPFLLVSLVHCHSFAALICWLHGFPLHLLT